MTKAIARDPIYRRRRFQPEIIELCVRWYLTYRLSYRDLAEMMAERGITVSLVEPEEEGADVAARREAILKPVSSESFSKNIGVRNSPAM